MTSTTSPKKPDARTSLMRCSVARAPSHGVRRLFRVRINATRLPSACERTAPTTQRTPRPDAVASRRSESRQQSTGAMVSPDQHPALGGLVKSVLSGWLAGLAIPLIGCGSAPAQQSATTPLPVAPSHVPAPVDAESERLYNEAVRELASFRSHRGRRQLRRRVSKIGNRNHERLDSRSICRCQICRSRRTSASGVATRRIRSPGRSLRNSCTRNRGS